MVDTGHNHAGIGFDPNCARCKWLQQDAPGRIPEQRKPLLRDPDYMPPNPSEPVTEESILGGKSYSEMTREEQAEANRKIAGRAKPEFTSTVRSDSESVSITVTAKQGACEVTHTEEAIFDRDFVGTVHGRDDAALLALRDKAEQECARLLALIQ